MHQNKYNVLSLFDGISIAHAAFKISNVKINKYYSSEIENHSIQISKDNHEQIHIGSVTDISYKNKSLIYNNIIEPVKIDILIGGSPCQSLSFAGKQKGLAAKGLNEENIDILTLEQYLELKHNGFEFEGQSYLFWEYIRLLREIKPKFFFLENVVMEEKWEKIFTENLGFPPIKINSRLFTCQNRPRLYWTNIPYNINTLPNKLHTFKDIKQFSTKQKDYYSDKALNWLVSHSYRKFLSTGKVKKLKIYNDDTIINAITASHCKKYSGQRFFAILDNGIDNKIQKDKIQEIFNECFNENDFTKLSILTDWEMVLYNGYSYRYITPEECELAQGLNIGYTKSVCDTSRYKSIGNGFTVFVIAWFLKNLK